METLPVIPFRWDVARPERLGTLVRGPAAVAYPGFHEDLRGCCAGVVAAAADCDLFFVGRSPESVHDYLSGACAGTGWAGRLHRLNVSLRHSCEPSTRAVMRAMLPALRAYLAALGLHPAELARRPRPAAMVDLVYSGGTFGQLIRLLYGWSTQIRADWAAVSRKLRFVGVVKQSDDRDKTFRWERAERQAVTLLGGRTRVRNVVVPARLWRYLADDQHHVARSYTPAAWGHPAAQVAPRGPPHLEALRQAVHLFQHARHRDERLAFLREVARAGALRHRDVRPLVSGLRGLGRDGGLALSVKDFTSRLPVRSSSVPICILPGG